MEASEKAARLAERIQPLQDEDAERKESQARHSSSSYVLKFESDVKLGQKKSDV